MTLDLEIWALPQFSLWKIRPCFHRFCCWLISLYSDYFQINDDTHWKASPIWNCFQFKVAFQEFQLPIYRSLHATWCTYAVQFSCSLITYKLKQEIQNKNSIKKKIKFSYLEVWLWYEQRKLAGMWYQSTFALSPQLSEWKSKKCLSGNFLTVLTVVIVKIVTFVRNNNS